MGPPLLLGRVEFDDCESVDWRLFYLYLFNTVISTNTREMSGKQAKRPSQPRDSTTRREGPVIEEKTQKHQSSVLGTGGGEVLVITDVVMLSIAVGIHTVVSGILYGVLHNLVWSLRCCDLLMRLKNAAKWRLGNYWDDMPGD